MSSLVFKNLTYNSLMSHGIKHSLVSNFFLLLFFPVPKWILEGRCNMGLFISGATTTTATKQSQKEAEKRPIMKQIEYFPHNDTLHALYQCPKESQMRIRTCIFSNNVGNRLFLYYFTGL